MKRALNLAGLLAWGLLPIALPAAAEQQPNIVFILADDLRDTSLGCAGNPVVETPNIDRLAGQGVRFAHSFVNSSICMASRASLFTGLTETGHGYSGAPSPSIPVIQADVDASFPVLLRAAGYRTGFFGKQHVAFAEGNDAALDRMFDEWKEIWRNPYFKEQADGSLRHTADLIGDRSVAFLESQSEDRPFFLYLSFNVAHAEDGDHRPGIGHFPWPASVDGLYEDVEMPRPRLDGNAVFDAHPEFLKTSLNRERWFWRWDTPEKYQTNMRAMYRMITGMDRVIGRVLETLDRRGLAENTVVVFASDNGYYMGERGFAGKWTHYEESLRVPLIVHDPRLPDALAGRVLPQMAVNIDLPPTFLDLAGVPAPGSYQGRSLLPVLRGTAPEDWRTDYFCEHHMNYEGLPKWRGVRGERYVYAHYYEQGAEGYTFLHDLKADPDQLVNYAPDPDYADVLERMRRRSEEYRDRYARPEIVALKAAMEESEEGGE